MNSLVQQAHDLRKIKQLTVFSAFTLLAGIVALALAASPVIALIGKLVIVVACVAFAAAAMAYVTIQSFAAHVHRNENFRWM